MLSTKKRIISTLFMLSMLLLIIAPTEGGSYADTDGVTYEECDDLYYEALNQKTITNVRTTNVKKGTFSVINTIIPRADVVSSSYIVNFLQGGTIKFKNYTVSTGTYVHVGDPICNISVTIDEDRVNELDKKILEEEESLNIYAETCEQLLADYERRFNAGGSDATLAKLLYDRLKVDYDKEVESRRNIIDGLQSEYDMIRSSEMYTSLTSSAEGYVWYLAWFSPGDTLDPWEFIGIVYNTDNVRIAADSGGALFRFNQPVTLTQKNGTDIVQMDGIVGTSINTNLPASLVGSKNRFLFEGDYSQFNMTKDVILKVESVHMENALMVSNNAIHEDTRGSYVITMENGKRIRKYIIIGGKNNDDTWIISGAEEGDTVIVS